MSYLVDTKILLRSCQKNNPAYSSTVSAVETLLEQGNKLYIAPQNIIEFWNVATRPTDKNGLGMSVEEADSEIIRLQSSLLLKPDLPTVHYEWYRLVKDYQVKGVKVHDTRLVAFAIAHKLTHILTFNIRDFKRFTEIIAISPEKNDLR